MATEPKNRTLTIQTLNPNVKAMEYVVRGPLVIRAGEIENELQKGVPKPFTEVIKANIGDCHAMGQIPITFIRQVLSLVIYPPLLENPRFPEDAKERVQTILKGCRGGSIGSYTESAGIEIIRKHIAEYIERRDGGIPCNWKNILLSEGASDGIKKVLKLFKCDIDDKQFGVMVPIPQYPLYIATLSEFNVHRIKYYLDESQEWGLNITELQRSIEEARKICYPRALVVINPGNPTGQVLSRQNIEEIIKFAYKENLFILADEVYQDNVYADEFHSFKKVLMEMGKPYNTTELASFMSCSKGYMGECGLRGGYAEVINMCADAKAMFFKANPAMLCPNVIGQACVDAVVRPPEVGEPSYEKFRTEKAAVLDLLKQRAKMVVDAFNSIEGFSCNTVQGAMYAFPQIKLPPKAIEAAKERNQAADEFYAFQLLETTGVCIVPSTGFGQQPGKFHFRTTILPKIDKLTVMLAKIRAFHKEFCNKYK